MDAFRPSWDDYFMAIARIVATRSTCNRLRAGAVLVKNNRIISTGYNGAPPGLPHCDGQDGHLMDQGHCVRTVHGEENTILQAALIGGISPVGGTLYTTYTPCYHCAKKIIVAGITTIIAGAVYKNSIPSPEDAFRHAGVTVQYYAANPAWDDYLQRIFRTPLKTAETTTTDPDQQTL